MFLTEALTVKHLQTNFFLTPICRYHVLLRIIHNLVYSSRTTSEHVFSMTQSLWPYSRLVSHRAGGHLAPENTMRAFEKALEIGAMAIETDVMLTRDSVPVLSHDETLGRAIAGSGNICDLTWYELRQCDAGIRFASEYSGTPVLLFEESLTYCREHGIWMNVELKPATGFDVATAKVAADSLTRLWEPSDSASPLISSFSETALEAFAKAAPDYTRALLLETLPADWLQRAQRLGAKAVNPDADLVTEDFVKKAHAAGMGIMCYTVDDPVRARDLFAIGVDSICTNRFDLLAKIL